MKRILPVCLLAALLISGCEKSETSSEVEAKQEQQMAFFDQLAQLCDETFNGETVFPNDPRHEMHGSNLKMHVKECGEKEIQIPFYVDDDSSRTWILRKTDNGLQLKHDHRHNDGTASEETNYGGYANSEGNENRQFFEADSFTVELIPEASTNVWMMEIDQENNNFIYYLEREGSPRYRAEFSING